MKRATRTHLSLLLFCLLSMQSAFAQFDPIGGLGGRKPAKPQVKANLAADVDSIQPGRSFRLGVRYRMQPEWHIYWHNWGDSGLATDIQWELPDGWKVGPLQWPAPERFVTAAGEISITGYGYHKETLLFAEVTPPEKITDQMIELKVKTRWLACRESCIPGQESLSIRLPVGPAHPSREREKFDRHASQVPVSVQMSGTTGHYTTQQIQISIPGLEDIQFTPGEGSILNLKIMANEGWEFQDTGDSADHHPGFYPYAVEDWENTHAGRAVVENGKIKINWPVEPSPQAKDGQHELAGVLRVPLRKTDDERVMDVVLELTVPAWIGKAGAVAAMIPAPKPDAPATVSVNQPDKGKEGSPRGFSFLETKRHEKSVWFFLMLAFLGGALLNVMPCVLPVISIKILSFVRQANEDPGRIFRMGLMFVLGVLASFAVLALTVIGLRAAGTAVGWGFHLQNPIFVIIMAAVVLAFSLSLLDVFSIDLSASMNRGVDSATQQEGYAGAFMNGVLATALSTPCVAPLLGTAVGYAFTKSGPVILAFFLTTGLGLAFPYFLLSMNPGWLKWLPKPGNWMVTFKKCMAVLLLATVVWLLYVVFHQVGSTGTWLTLTFMAFVCIASWLYGKGMDLRASRVSRRITPWLVTAILALGFHFLPYRHIQSIGENLPGSSSGSAEVVQDGDTIPWVSFDIDAIEKMVKDNKAVFIDFTADWCASCKVNESVAIETGAVRKILKEFGVIPVKADWTRRDETILDVLNQFGESGVPLYVLLPPGMADQPVILPKVLTPGSVVRVIRETLQPNKVVETTSPITADS